MIRRKSLPKCSSKLSLIKTFLLCNIAYVYKRGQIKKGTVQLLSQSELLCNKYLG